MRFETKSGQNGKKKEKNRVLQFEKMYLLSAFFLLVLWLSISKMFSRA
jgi:hypothetical protein